MSTRRAFLQTSLASAGSLATLTVAQSGRTGCGLALGTYGLQSMRLEDAIRLVAATGYNAIEITAIPGTTGAPSILTSGDRAKLRQLLADSGLRLCAIMADLQPKRLEADHKSQLAEVYHLIKLGQDLSPDATPVVQTVLGGKDWGESRDFFRDRIANWVQIAADLRGFLSIKPHRHQAMSLPSEASWLIEQLGSPERLGLVYDYSHCVFRNPEMTIDASVRESLPHVNYVAVKDALKEGQEVKFALAGETGSWDQATVISALYDGGYRGDFCCEVSSQIWKNNPAYDPINAAKKCFQNMQDAFARAGVARR